MAPALPRTPRLTKPGLFITGTDTGVGKTVVSCAIAWHLRQQADEGRDRVAVCKPIATGCRRDREGLVSEDAEALAHFADCREPLEVINPVRYRQPVAPAVAAEQTRLPVDGEAIVTSLERLDAEHDCLLVEGIGGLLVPLDARHPDCTVLELIEAIGLPVLIVTRAALGTLSHTAMTVRLLRAARQRIAGIVINGFVADASGTADAHVDASMTTNRTWLSRMNDVPVLATVPACPADTVAPQKGRLPAAVLDAVRVTYWPRILSAS